MEEEKRGDLRLLGGAGREEEQQYSTLRAKQRGMELDNKHKEEDLRGKEQDREQRKAYALKIFWLLCIYLICVGGLVVLSGLSCVVLSDAVLVTLLGTNCASVISLSSLSLLNIYSPIGNEQVEYRQEEISGAL